MFTRRNSVKPWVTLRSIPAKMGYLGREGGGVSELIPVSVEPVTFLPTDTLRCLVCGGKNNSMIGFRYRYADGSELVACLVCRPVNAERMPHVLMPQVVYFDLMVPRFEFTAELLEGKQGRARTLRYKTHMN